MTSRRGRIKISQERRPRQNGWREFIGECDIIDCFEVGRRTPNGQVIPVSNGQLDVDRFVGSPHNIEKHCVMNWQEMEYDRIYAWALSNRTLYPEPKPYKHKKGCVIWQELR